MFPKRDYLREEMATFDANVAILQKENAQGGFVVIRGNEILGVWRDRIDALRVGVEKYGDVPFLVRDIFADDKPINMSRDLIFS